MDTPLAPAAPAQPVAPTPSGPGPLAKLIAMSKANPSSDLAQHTLSYIKSGQYDAQAAKEGIDLSWARPNAPVPKNPAPAGPNEVDTYKNNLMNSQLEGGNQIMDAVKAGSDTLQHNDGSLMGEIGTGAKLAGSGIDAGLAGIGTLFAPISAAVQTLSQNASDNPHVQQFSQAISPALDQANKATTYLQQLAQEHPEIAKNVNRIMGLATLEEGSGAAGKAAELSGKASDAIQPVVDAAGSAINVAAGKAKQGLDAAGKAVESKIPNVSDAGKTVNDIKLAATGKNQIPALGESAGRIREAANVSKANTERADAAGNPMRQGVGNTTVESPATTYKDYFQKTKDALADTKKDNAIQDLGSKIGDLFRNVVGQRQVAGKALGTQLKTVEDKPIDISATQDAIHHDLADNKVAFDPKEGEIINTGNQSKLTGADKTLLGKYMTQLQSLGDNPTVGDLDAFIGRIPREIKELKATNNITFKTNAERIIGNSLDALRGHFDQFPEYNTARQKFADLAQFTSQNAAKLGKMTPTGDFAKDASLAKRSVQSNLDNGSKDFLMELGERTGFPIVDHAVLALQAMKDAGDYRGASLLENTMGKALTQGHIPVTATDMMNTAAGHLIKAGAQKFIGTPYEQTVRYLESLENGAKP